MDPITLHRRALDHLRHVVASIPDDQWLTSTNCEPWDAATVLNHALSSQLLWVGAATGTERVPITEVVKPTPLEGDRLTRTDEVIAEAAETWAADGILDRDITGPFGTLPGRQTIVFGTIDALCHAWDLAVSCGVDATLPEDLLEPMAELADAAVNDQTRSFGLFADEPDIPADASATDRLMAKTGRRRP